MPLDLRLITATYNPRPSDIVVVPVGSIEQHCNLPIGTDCLIAEKLAWTVCDIFENENKSKCIVSPPICYAFSPEWARSPGTISLSLETFHKLASDIVNGLVSWGFKRIVLFNAHGGNSNIIASVLAELSSNLKSPDVILAQIDYWRCTGINLGHASHIELELLRNLGIDLKQEGSKVTCLTATTSSRPGLRLFTMPSNNLEVLESGDKYLDVELLVKCIVKNIE